jgi:hypothetical protein
MLSPRGHRLAAGFERLEERRRDQRQVWCRIAVSQGHGFVDWLFGEKRTLIGTNPYTFSHRGCLRVTGPLRRFEAQIPQVSMLDTALACRESPRPFPAAFLATLGWERGSHQPWFHTTITVQIIRPNEVRGLVTPSPTVTRRYLGPRGHTNHSIIPSATSWLRCLEQLPVCRHAGDRLQYSVGQRSNAGLGDPRAWPQAYVAVDCEAHR